jgi:hypothetical protein
VPRFSHMRLLLIFLLGIDIIGCSRTKPSPTAGGNLPARSTVWPSQPPEGCPLPRSKDITGISFSGRHKEYTDADTWFPSWASDGNLYSPFTDGTVNKTQSWSGGVNATTGQAKIMGDDPTSLTIISLGAHKASPLPYGGRYPSASLVFNGIWFYGTYTVDDPYDAALNCGWCTMGPFVGFRVSYDYGLTWVDSKLTPEHNLLGESARGRKKIKMGAPHFVDFGKNLQYSPDGKAYLVAHGARDPGSAESWIKGDEVYLARVTPTSEDINDRDKWEYFAGYGADKRARWSNHFSEIQPILEWKGHCGVVTMTYDAGLRKYLMIVADPEGLGGTDSSSGHPQAHGVPYNTYILEAEQAVGPWSLVTYMHKFGEQAYFVNIPSKFISVDGWNAWLCYSNNWTGDQKANPPGGRYGLCLQEFKFLPHDPDKLPAAERPPR